MQYPDYRYVDCAFGSAAARNNVLPVDTVLGAVPEQPVDCYVTWRRFPEAYHTYWQGNLNDKGQKSVARYNGPSYSDYLPFDFDGSDLAEVLDRTQNFITMLQVQMEVPVLDSLRYFFSGSKGFHVLIPANMFGGWTPSEKLPEQQRLLALKLGNGFDIDPVLYDTNRMLRLNNTKNSKSGLFKVALTSTEILTMPLAEILVLAENPRQIRFSAWEYSSPVPTMVCLWEDALAGKDPVPGGIDLHRPDLATYFPTGLKEGDGRDNAAFTLAAACRNQGCKRDFALEILRLWNTRQGDPLEESVLRQKVQSAYGNTEESEQITVADIATPVELMAAYREYIEQLKSKRVRLGFPEVDRQLRAIAPGEVVTVMARSGVGKTAFLQNVLKNMAYNQDLVSLFCSMEQPLSMCAERYLQMTSRMNGQEVEQTINKDDETANHFLSQAISALGENTLTCGRSGLSFSQLDQVLDVAAQKRGKEVDVLALDYLGMLDLIDLGRSTYEQVSNAAKALKRLALRRKIVIILLCQVNRAAGEDGDQPLHRGSARDSGAIEESADYLLGLYRPDFKSGDQSIAVQILKNRKGFGTEVSYKFNRDSMCIESFTVEVPHGNGHTDQVPSPTVQKQTRGEMGRLL